MKHKVISLWQPWAQLMPMGHKRFETRGWQTSYRGWLLIHATAKFDKELALAITQIGAADILAEAGYDWRPWGKPTTLPLGAIIGSVNLIDCIPTHTISNLPPSADNYLSKKEAAFGDYSQGRYAWITSDPVLFKEPIPARGYQMLWEWEGELPVPCIG